MPLRTLIVDDEPHARKYLRTLLAADSDFEIAGECTDGGQAVTSLLELRPDVVFLDIQMPDLDGFEVLRAVNGEISPIVVFCTAYDQFALMAFEAFALDYLLKPFDEDRFARTLTRVKAQFRGQNGPDQTAALVESVAAQRRAPRRLLVKSGGRVLFLKFDDIRRIEAADNYVRFHTSEGEHTMRETITNIERQLPENLFIRIHRSAIVNLDLIREFQPLPGGEARVRLDDGTELTVSRRHRERVEARFAGRPNKG